MPQMNSAALQPKEEFRPLFITASILSACLIVGILYLAKVVLVPIAISIVLAFVLNPIVALLQRWHFPRVPAVLTTLLLVLLGVGGLATVVSLQVGALVNDLPTYEQNIRTKMSSVRAATQSGILNKIKSFVTTVVGGDAENNPDTPHNLPGEAVTARIVPDQGWLSGALAPLQTIAPALETAGTAFLSVIMTIFMLIRREDLRNRIVSFADHASLSTTTKAFGDAGSRISRYLLMQLFINGAFGLFVGVGLFFAGVPYAPLWGLCAAVLRYIPYVGAWIAAAPPLLVSFVTSPGWGPTIIVFLLFAILELLAGNVVEPLLYGHGTGVSEVALLVCATFWAWIWGPVGLILATPLTVCLVVTGKYVPALSFFDQLLGDRPALKPYVSYLQRLLARDCEEAASVVRDFCAQNPAETVFDTLFVPALALTRRDRDAGAMTADDEKFVLKETARILDDLAITPAPVSTPKGISLLQILITRVQNIFHPQAALTVSVEVAMERPHPAVLILGLPAHHQVEELTLRMLHNLVLPVRCEIECLPTRTLPSEMIAQVTRRSPALVFIAAMPPGGLPQASFLCESLREINPQLGILVGFWGADRNLDEVILNLKGAGASYVTTTLLGARSHIEAMLQSSPPPAAADSTDATKRLVSTQT